MELLKKAQISREAFAQLTDGLGCNCGYDLGKRVDLSGVAAVFPLPDGRIALKLHGFMPEGGATRHEQTDRVPYKDWARDGYCTLTPGDVTDNSYVYNWICEGERDHHWQVAEVDYDGHNATDLAIRMREERNNESFCVEIAQTCAGQNLAVKGFRELLLEGKIVLEENPLAVWCFGNAIEIQNNYGDIKLSKKHKDDTERIDPVAAGMNALARILVKRQSGDRLRQQVDEGSFTF
jgi:phage terminase large subunit-like protein